MAQILTKQDLDAFKTELLKEIKNIVAPPALPVTRKWLKTYEVKEMLGLSQGTLHTMRSKGILEYSKIGGLFLYKYEHIINLMEKNKKGGTKKQSLPKQKATQNSPQQPLNP